MNWSAALTGAGENIACGASRPLSYCTGQARPIHQDRRAGTCHLRSPSEYPATVVPTGGSVCHACGVAGTPNSPIRYRCHGIAIARIPGSFCACPAPPSTECRQRPGQGGGARCGERPLVCGSRPASGPRVGPRWGATPRRSMPGLASAHSARSPQRLDPCRGGRLVWGFFCQGVREGGVLCFLRRFLCSNLKARFFIPTRHSGKLTRAGAVKAGRLFGDHPQGLALKVPSTAAPSNAVRAK